METDQRKTHRLVIVDGGNDLVCTFPAARTRYRQAAEQIAALLNARAGAEAGR